MTTIMQSIDDDTMTNDNGTTVMMLRKAAMLGLVVGVLDQHLR